MKKLHVLIPSLVATAGMPLIGLVGCGCQPGKEKIKFSISDAELTKVSVWEFTLNWDHPDHVLEFDDASWHFGIEVGPATSIEYNSTTHRITASFGEDVSDYNIDNGLLLFSYNDLTTGQTGIAAEVRNIHIPVPTRVCFNTCDWSFVIKKCYSYEQHGNPNILTSYFYFDDPTTPEEEQILPTDIKDFAGQQRIIHLDTLDETGEYYVKVLGVAQDYVSISPRWPAAMTFQFDTLVGTSPWGAAYNFKYWDGIIDTYLNKGAFLNRIKDFSVGAIRQVYRMALTFNNNSWAPTLSQQPVYCFMPLLSNIFSSTGLSNSLSDSSLYIDEGKLPNFPDQQTQYTYYQQHISDQAFCEYDDISRPNYFPELYKTTKQGAREKYWLTTPLISSYDYSFCVDSRAVFGKGGISTDMVKNIIYVAPCFCI